MDRYARQKAFAPLGQAGQEKLLQSKVAIIGMGALGTVAANNLCRSGVGYLRLVDRDYVELSNLQRQVLFTEEDAKKQLPKAVAACAHLSRVNSEIRLEPVVSDVNGGNVAGLMDDMDLVLDATDNWEVRFLLNEACHASNIPWIYAAALGSSGMTMNILPGKQHPCLRCLVPDTPSDTSQSCSTVGVLNMVTNAIASLQTAEAIKILTDSPQVREGLFSLDVWDNQAEVLKIDKDSDCPVCVHGRYTYLGQTAGTSTTVLCGSNAIQVMPQHPGEVAFAPLAKRLTQVGTVHYNDYTLTFSDGAHEIVLFRDGRAMIKNAIDEGRAKSLYVEYFGL